MKSAKDRVCEIPHTVGIRGIISSARLSTKDNSIIYQSLRGPLLEVDTEIECAIEDQITQETQK